MESVYMNAWLFAEKFVQILNKADDHHDSRTRQSDEKEIYQKVHPEIDDCVHTSILLRSGVLGRYGPIELDTVI